MSVFILFLNKIINKTKSCINKIEYYNIRTKYKLPADFIFNGPGITMYGDGEIIIGKNSYIGRYSSLQVDKDVYIKIGDNCRISHFVMMYTTTKYANQNFNSRELKNYKKSITIGDGVWIGANVFINPGIHIGNNSVVGANSVVTGDVPANSIVGGIPARLIRIKD